jgi:hypothetical protein
MAADEEAERANARRHATKIEADYEHERLQAALRYSMLIRMLAILRLGGSDRPALYIF